MPSTPGALKPDSKYHLAFNIGYPNALDRALGRTGEFIMVHGNCVSVGCFAMSDALIEEVYAFVRDALAAGQPSVPVHVFPFHMTAENMKRHADNPARDSWEPLQEAYADFATSREPPRVGMCGKHYVVNRDYTRRHGPERRLPDAHRQAHRAVVAASSQKARQGRPGSRGRGTEAQDGRGRRLEPQQFLVRRNVRLGIGKR